MGTGIDGGYGSQGYARSLSYLGPAIYLAASQSWLIRRPIPNTPYFDAMGCYPLWCCDQWSKLDEDLSQLNDIVSVVGIASPLASHTVLKKVFSDCCKVYKNAYLANAHTAWIETVTAHHRRNIKRAYQHCHVDIVDALAHVDTWMLLYRHLIKRHQINGVARFTKAAFIQQLRLPGLTAMAAYVNREIVGMVLWIRHGHMIYYHLGAYNERGYQHLAGFALFAFAFDYFANVVGIEQIYLGAGTHTIDPSRDGLARFKCGWSTHTQPIYLCGKILQADIYQQLIHDQTSPTFGDFFPMYRT